MPLHVGLQANVYKNSSLQVAHLCVRTLHKSAAAVIKDRVRDERVYHQCGDHGGG